MKYIIKRTDQDGGYVSQRGRKEAYTNDIRHIRQYHTLEEAERNLCIGNEVIEPLETTM